MNLRVAQRARLILGGLVVERRRAGRRPVHIGRMTPEAKKVDVVDLQQSRIGGAVRRMARQAALIRLHRSVFEDEWAHRVGVALSADGKLAGGGPHLAAGLGAVRIMTVAALDQSHIDPVTVRPGEFGLLCGMTAEAQGGLRFHQHEVDVSGIVRVVTGGAAHAIRQMHRRGKILRLQTGLVALQADRRGFGRAQLFEANDFCDVAATVHMRLARAVTPLATVLIAFEQCRVGSTREMLFPDILVAGLADVRIGILTACRTRKRG